MANYQLEQTGAEVQALLNAVESPDTTPAAGSSNLITSGAVQAAVAGVSAEVTALGQEVDGVTITQAENAGTANSYWKDDGGVISYAASGAGIHRADMIPILPGFGISFTTTGASYGTVPAAHFCDDDGNIILTIPRDGTTTSFSGVIPENATRLYLNYLSTYQLVLSGIKDAVGTLVPAFNDIEDEVFGMSYGLTHGYTSGSRWYDNSGIIGNTSSSTFVRMNAIPVSQGDVLSYSVGNAGLGTIPVIFIADESGNILLSSLITNDKVRVPEGAAYVYFNTAGSPLVFSVSFVGLKEELREDVSTINGYLAKGNGPQSKMLLSSSDFEVGNIDAETGGPSVTANVIRMTKGARVAGGAILSYHTDGGYRMGIASYSIDGFIKKNEWYSGDGTYQLPADAFKIKLTIANPTGQTGTPSFDDAGLVVSVNPGLVITEAAPLVAFKELPIYAPNPQLPANSSSDSDFDAETLTPAELFGAFSDMITALPKPGTAYDKPKFAVVSSKVGRDASNTYDIYAYQFGKKNRFAYKAADGLFAWKNGGTLVYTDSISPRVGDTIYSSTTRTDSGATIASFNSADQQITSSASVTYTRSNDDNVAVDVLWTTSAQSISSPVNKTLNKRDGSNAGVGTATDYTHFTLSGKSYVRCEELDYHTDQKMTIVLWGNEHGPQSDPAEPAITLYRLAKDLCGGCRDNKFISFLKNYCNIVMIPCANPYGLQTHNRNNANNVNINRNYCTPGWSSQADADKGSYAGDQPETQFIMNTVAYFGADIAIDIHCLGYTQANNAGKVHWDGFIPFDDANNKVYDCMMSYSVEYSKYGDATPNTRATGGDWIYYIGINGGLIEMNAGAYAASGGDGKQHTPYFMELDYTLLLNTLRMWMTGKYMSLDLSKYSIK